MKPIIGILVISVLPALLISCISAEAALPPVSESEPRIEAEPEPVVEPESEPVIEPEAEAEEHSYEVTQEVYEQTFEEIEAFISELNGVISRRQFERWTGYLSSTYIGTYNDESVLSEINQYPQLKDNDIILKSLKDYFDWVVVPSRSRAVLDDIVFVGEDQVTAYSSFEGKRAKLYELQRLDGEWKITVW